MPINSKGSFAKRYESIFYTSSSGFLSLVLWFSMKYLSRVQHTKVSKVKMASNIFAFGLDCKVFLCAMNFPGSCMTVQLSPLIALHFTQTWS